jgi:hypothetical protein
MALNIPHPPGVDAATAPAGQRPTTVPGLPQIVMRGELAARKALFLPENIR